jgi:hypothetical protein
MPVNPRRFMHRSSCASRQPRAIADLQHEVSRMLRERFPGLDPIVKSLRIGPGRDAKIEARFSGPGPVRCCDTLPSRPRRSCAPTGGIGHARRLAVTGEAGGAGVQRAGWPAARASPEDLASACATPSRDCPRACYRDGVRLLPIKMRADEESADVGAISATCSSGARRAGAHRTGVLR